MYWLNSVGSVMYTLLFVFLVFVEAQTTTTFPAPALYPDGAFSVPDTVRNPILDQGATLNVTWTTTYEIVNLYLIFAQEFNHPKALAVSTTDTFFLWTVDDAGNNTSPFVLRIVNATGTVNEQALGGFITGKFWIRDSSVMTTVSTTHTTSQANVGPTTTTTSQTSSSKSSTTSESTRSSTISDSSDATASPGSGTSITSTPSQSPSLTSTMSDNTQTSSKTPASDTATAMPAPAQTQNPSSGPSTGAIAGIVIGAVAVLAIIIGISLYFRRQRRPTTSSRHLDVMDLQMAQKGQPGTDSSGYTLRDPSWDSSRKGPAELQEDELVELPNYRSSRQHELP